MVLGGFGFDSGTVIYILCLTLGILVVAILYRQMLRYFNRGSAIKANYCVLYSLEKDPATGILEFYFTSDQVKLVTLNALDQDMAFFAEISSAECHTGGNIIRYDSTQLPNGNYYYCLQTSNQKTMKKMRVYNT